MRGGRSVFWCFPCIHHSLTTRGAMKAGPLSRCRSPLSYHSSCPLLCVIAGPFSRWSSPFWYHFTVPVSAMYAGPVSLCGCPKVLWKSMCFSFRVQFPMISSTHGKG